MKEIDYYVDTYADMIFRVAYHNTDNIDDAQDIVQEVFLRLLKKKPQFKDENHEKAWLIRVTINKAKDLHKSFWFRKRLPLDKDYYIKDNQTKGILEEVMQLPIQYRNPIYLYYYEGYDTKEIAQILHITQNTVLTRLRRARLQLKQRWEEQHEKE